MNLLVIRPAETGTKQAGLLQKKQ